MDDPARHPHVGGLTVLTRETTLGLHTYKEDAKDNVFVGEVALKGPAAKRRFAVCRDLWPVRSSRARFSRPGLSAPPATREPALANPGCWPW